MKYGTELKRESMCYRKSGAYWLTQLTPFYYKVFNQGPVVTKAKCSWSQMDTFY